MEHLSGGASVAHVEAEQLLIERAKVDDAAFEQLYHAYVDKIYGYIYKRTGHRESAEDITSQVFMKMCLNLKSYSYRECPFAAWLYKIASNCLIDHYRAKERRPEVLPEEMPEVHDRGQDLQAGQEARDEATKVRAVIARLPERYQKALELKFFAELTNQEIADVLGISPNNVGVLLHRALGKFEEVYQTYV